MLDLAPRSFVNWAMNIRLPGRVATALFLASLVLAARPSSSGAAPLREIVVTTDLRLEQGAQLPARLIIRASHVTVDGQGATLVGPGQTGDLKSLEAAGIGILLEGAADVTIKNIKARGFASGLVIRQARAISVTGCDFSDNYHNPKHGWGELPARGGLLLEQVRHSVIRQNRANRVWDGIHLLDSDDNLIADNDFSFCSNTCAKLWKSSRNKFLNNNLSYGLRIDRAAGEVHARDSTCVLIETGSDDNYWYRNDISHGGDGVFIRPLNRWVSRGNVFVENDTSYANNNCVESWSPGNTFIRNKANHGSYGFWLGGSDQTVLIGNEAAFNGRPDGYHNAPEAGFSHGGIVIVGGPSTHTLIQGNDLHGNNGAGLAFRGDGASQGRAWRTDHWIVQQNRFASNRFGIWGRWGDAMVLAANTFTNNAQANVIQDTTNLIELPPGLIQTAPCAALVGPEVVVAGQPARFDASLSHDPQGRPLRCHWWLDGSASDQPVLERVFDKPGFHRVSLTVENGALADLVWRDLLVVQPVAEELGTEGQAHRWGFELENNDNRRGRVLFEDDPAGLIGGRSLKFTPNPYPGAYATAVYPATRDAAWNFVGRRQIRFWIKGQNPNVPGYQNAGPVVRLHGRTGQIEFKPVKDGNLLNDPPFSEARWLWMPVIIPLDGDALWQRKVTGQVTLERIDALSLSLDSWGGDPFTIWLDGLTVE
jgi:parallel beta-helix repeat protein